MNNPSKKIPRKFIVVPAWVEWITQPRKRVHTVLRWTLLASLFLHLGITPLAPDNSLSSDQMQKIETEYSRKIDSTKSSKVVARNLSNKQTTPPPPPDPEGTIANTLSTSLQTGIEKVIGNLLDVNTTKMLKSKVAASLQADLKEMANDIMNNKLTDSQIKELHKKHQEKAQGTVLKELHNYRVETMEVRAAANTTEWYEKSVSRTLTKNLLFELHMAQYGKYRWHTLYLPSVNKHSNAGYRVEWGFLGNSGYELKVKQLASLVDEANKQSASPGKIQAEFLANRLREIQTPSAKPDPSGGSPKADLSFNEVLQDFCHEYNPENEKETYAKCSEKLGKLWSNARDKANAYVKQAESGVAEAELASVQKIAFDATRALATASSELIPKNARDYFIINQTVRSRVMRGESIARIYKFWVDGMVEGLSPFIKELAQDQFKAGKIVQKDSFDKALAEFPNQIVPLLRRDMQALLPEKDFYTHVAFDMSWNPYKTKVTKKNCAPDENDIAADEAALEKVLASNPGLKTFAEKREQIVADDFKKSMTRVKEKLLELVLTGKLLLKNMGDFVEGVNYADNVQEKLDAHTSAMKGRGQDLTALTADGVPDTNVPLVSLTVQGSSGQQEPWEASMVPGYMAHSQALINLRHTLPQFPPDPGGKPAILQAQAEIPNPFKNSPRFEAVPFLAKFPKLDGDLADWGFTRPLLLQPVKGKGGESIQVRVAWNYQGFFFGYEVKNPKENFFYPSGQTIQWNLQNQVGTAMKVEGCNWAFQGDHFRLFFDTLDARNINRGELHSQEFVILPMGTENDENIPGMERIINSQRDAKTNEYRKPKDVPKIFPAQPETGPDGSGPYRVTRMEKDGYSVECFVPRSLFKVPVFAPGWVLGFDCAVAIGFQGNNKFQGQMWAGKYNPYDDRANHPDSWGDLLLLGTDARIMLHSITDGKYEIAKGIVPGHSYLLTVIDPDRNVNPSEEDTVLVSAETVGGDADVEVLILKETERNSGMFRGYLDTQPGKGREVLGTLEMHPGQEVVLGYVDFANSKGERNVGSSMRLPVISGMMYGTAGKEQVKE